MSEGTGDPNGGIRGEKTGSALVTIVPTVVIRLIVCTHSYIKKSLLFCFQKCCYCVVVYNLKNTGVYIFIGGRDFILNSSCGY